MTHNGVLFPTHRPKVVCLAIITFNDSMLAMEPLLHHLSADCSIIATAFIASRDRKRVLRVKNSEEEVSKGKGKARKSNAVATEQKHLKA